jgi:hypothetical protein
MEPVEIKEDVNFEEWYMDVDPLYRTWKNKCFVNVEGGYHAHSSIALHLVCINSFCSSFGDLSGEACPSTSSASSDHHPAGTAHSAVGGTGEQ